MNNLNLFKYKNKKLILSKKDLLKITYSNKTIDSVKKCLNITKKCIYTRPAFDYRKITKIELETNNIFKFINNYMYGYCHEIAFLMKYLLKINRIKSRIVRLTSKKYKINHWVNEFLCKGKWIVTDPTLGLLFKCKLKNRFLSSHEIKKINPSNIITNKKIVLNKFSNLEKDNFFFYKKSNSFKMAKEKYFSCFNLLEYPTLHDGKFNYKKKIIKHHKLRDFMTYKESNFDEKNFKILPNKTKLGIQNGKLVKSNKFIKFKNFVFKKNNYSKIIKIKNFPYPILDIKFDSEDKKINGSLELENNKFKISSKNNIWLLKKIAKKKNIFLRAIRNIKIYNHDLIKSYEILFLASKYI